LRETTNEHKTLESNGQPSLALRVVQGQ